MPTYNQTTLTRRETPEEMSSRAVRLGESLGLRVVPYLDRWDVRDEGIVEALRGGDRVPAWGLPDGTVSILVASLRSPYEMDRIIVRKAVEAEGLRALFPGEAWDDIRREAYISIPEGERWRYPSDGGKLAAGERFMEDSVKEFEFQQRGEAASREQAALMTQRQASAVSRVAMWMRMAKLMNPALAAATVLDAVSFNNSVVAGARAHAERIPAQTPAEREAVSAKLGTLLRRMDRTDEAREELAAAPPLVLGKADGTASALGILPPFPFSVKPAVINRGSEGTRQDPGFDPLLLSQLPEALRNPVAIFAPKEGNHTFTLVIPVKDGASPDRLVVVSVMPLSTKGVNAVTAVYTKEARDILGWVNGEERMLYARPDFGGRYLIPAVSYAIVQLEKAAEMYASLLDGKTKLHTEPLSNTTDLSVQLGQAVSGRAQLAADMLSGAKVLKTFRNPSVQTQKTFVIRETPEQRAASTVRIHTEKGDGRREEVPGKTFRSPEEYGRYREGLVAKDRQNAAKQAAGGPAPVAPKQEPSGGVKRR